MPNRAKPSFPKLNRSHPLAQGLIYDIPLFEGAGNKPNELTKNISGLFAGSPNPTWVNNRFGRALDFVGTASGGEAVYYTPRVRGSTVYSLETVAMFRSGGSGNAGTIFRTTDGTNSQITFRVSFNVSAADGFLLSHRWSSATISYRSQGLTVGSIYHVIVTYDGSNIANIPVMYVNGVQQTLIKLTDPVGTIDSTSDSQIVIGNINQTGNVGTRTWDGTISYVRMWNRVLSAQEASQLNADPFQIYRKKSFLIGRSTPIVPAPPAAISHGKSGSLSNLSDLNALNLNAIL